MTKILHAYEMLTKLCFHVHFHLDDFGHHWVITGASVGSAGFVFILGVIIAVLRYRLWRSSPVRSQRFRTSTVVCTLALKLIDTGIL